MNDASVAVHNILLMHLTNRANHVENAVLGYTCFSHVFYFIQTFALSELAE